MPLPSNGLIKLAEECGEAVQAAMKLVAYPSGAHPDGTVDPKARLEDELADVMGAIAIVRDTLGLDLNRMEKRSLEKYALFSMWRDER